MGVDWITCENPQCKENFPDCGNFDFCYGCESYFCDGCGKIDYDEDNEENSTCILCRKEEVTSSDLVHYLLTRFGLSYDQAVEDYKKEGK